MQNSQLVIIKLVITFFTLGLMMFACSEDDKSYPRPRGYFRIDFPVKTYQTSSSILPFQFDHPTYSQLSQTKSDGRQCQTNLEFPRYNATLHCAYLNDSNLNEHIRFAKTMAYKHKSTAQSIDEIPFRNDSSNVFGLLYDIQGEKVASNYSFYIMDRSSRFFRGSFYFNQTPNSDSLKPVLAFLKKDLDRLIQSFSWSNHY